MAFFKLNALTVYAQVNQFLDDMDTIDDPKIIISKSLAFLLEIYQADRAFMAEIDEELNIGVITYEVSAKDSKTPKMSTSEATYDVSADWITKLNQRETVIINDALKEPNKITFAFLKERHINNIIMVPFANKDVCGYIGVINPKINKTDDIAIKAMSYLLKKFLSEIRQEEKLELNTKNKNIKSKKDIYVKTFGDFKISTYFGTFDDNTISKQCLIFFVYLLIKKGKPVSIDKLTSILWPDQDVFEPYNYIKNIAFRTRKTFNNYLDEKIIVAKNGSYACNPSLNIITD